MPCNASWTARCLGRSACASGASRRRFPGRNQDELGIAVAAAHNGTPFIKAQRDQGMRERRSEVTLELTYLAQFGSHLAVQPDLQFVINPNTDPRI
jgi:porin